VRGGAAACERSAAARKRYFTVKCQLARAFSDFPRFIKVRIAQPPRNLLTRRFRRRTTCTHGHDMTS